MLKFFINLLQLSKKRQLQIIAKYFLKYTLLAFVLVHFNFCFSQIIFEQDICHCGITGDGYSPGFSSNTGQFEVNIDSGSTIKEAYLFISIYKNNSENTYEVSNKTILFDGALLNLDSVNFISNEFKSFQTSITTYQKIAYFNVTDYISTTNNIYSITPPFNQIGTPFGTIATEYYLYIIYEKSTFKPTGYSIIINNQNVEPNLSYTINQINKIDLTNDANLTLNTSGLCDTSILLDGSYVKINNNPIGLIGGQEPNSNYCSGPTGSFYYQDSTLYGLGNDEANNTMSGIDLIANIQSYITNPTSFDVEFEYQDIGSSGDKTNAILELFLAYTTPCDTFSVSVPNDTIVCRGTQLQLNVSGGQKYEWLPSTGLSCDTCANPIFTADSSMNYTVRIWNNDTCSVVRPLQILVSQPKIDTLIISPPTCGTNDGEIAVNASSFSWLDLSYSGGGAFQTDSVLSNLAEGTITLTVQDEAGCSVDTTFFLPSVNNTNALFTVNPPGGEDVPMVIWANSTSQNANQFEWWIDSILVGNNNEQYHTFNTSGAHEIMLVAWQYDPNCADTSIFEFNIKRKVIIPTAFTPDGDGINDFWEILYLDELYPQNKVFVYNRWGNLVYESEEGKYGERAWAGASTSSASGGGKLPVGSYFYVIKTGTNDADFTGSVTVVR